MVPYDSSVASREGLYNFCFLCKDRLEVIHDEFDEGWYFVNAKQIRVKGKSGEQKVHNVHALCLKEIELSDKHKFETKTMPMLGKVGEKRPRVVYERFGAGPAEWKGSLSSMVQSLEAERKRKHLEMEAADFTEQKS